MSDYIIDVHASKNCTEFVLINNDNYVKNYVEFCNSLDIKYAVWEGSKNTIKSFANQNNKIAFTVECDGIQTINHKSLVKTMKIIKKISLNKIHNLIENTTFEESLTLQTVTSNHEGFLIWTDKTNYFIRSIDGNILEISNIEKDNKIIILRNLSGYIKQNDYLYQYQPQ